MIVIVISVIILLICLILGLCVPAAFGASFTAIAFLDGQSLASLIPTGFNKINTVVLLAIPLFVLSGGLIERGKLGKALTDFVEFFVGKLPGGLGIVAVVSSAVLCIPSWKKPITIKALQRP